jgi:hypothetical protein
MFSTISVFLDNIDIAAFSWREVLLFDSVLFTLLCIIVFYITHYFTKQWWHGRPFDVTEWLDYLRENKVETITISHFGKFTQSEDGDGQIVIGFFHNDSPSPKIVLLRSNKTFFENVIGETVATINFVWHPRHCLYTVFDNRGTILKKSLLITSLSFS